MSSQSHGKQKEEAKKIFRGAVKTDPKGPFLVDANEKFRRLHR